MDLKCNSCALAFISSDGQKAHYRTELHRYNLKRRTNDLGPVTEAEFQRRKAAAQALAGGGMSSAASEAGGFHAKCQPCNRSFASKATLEQHLQSKKHLASVADGGDKATTTTTTTTKNEAAPPATPTTGTSGMLIDGLAKVAVGKDANAVGDDDAPPPLPVDLSAETCIFCNDKCGTLEAAVLHMWKRHGFHIPDGEYLVDLRGLLRYCAEKVKVGCMCLYCNGKGKGFFTARDVQRHMESKSHCKLLYEDGEDLHEFRPFYDFTTSYALPKRVAKGEADANEEEEDDDDDVSLETVDSDYEEEEEEDGMAVESEEVEQLLRQGALHVSALGELVLPDGRCLGNREYARYYKQRYRPEDTRTSLVACKLEAAERMGLQSTALVNAAGPGGGKSLMVRSSDGNGMWGPDKAARRAVLKVTAAAQRARDKYRLRKEISTNKFHKRPQIDG